MSAGRRFSGVNEATSLCLEVMTAPGQHRGSPPSMGCLSEDITLICWFLFKRGVLSCPFLPSTLAAFRCNNFISV